MVSISKKCVMIGVAVIFAAAALVIGLAFSQKNKITSNALSSSAAEGIGPMHVKLGDDGPNSKAGKNSKASASKDGSKSEKKSNPPTRKPTASRDCSKSKAAKAFSRPTTRKPSRKPALKTSSPMR